MSLSSPLSAVVPSSRPDRTSRARLTNDPLSLPHGVSAISADGRRWRDLMHAYAAALGERMQREDVRTIVRSLVSLTLINERLNAQVARNEPVDPNNVIQTAQTIVRLLSELGLKQAPQPASAPDLDGYLKRGRNAT